MSLDTRSTPKFNLTPASGPIAPSHADMKRARGAREGRRVGRLRGRHSVPNLRREAPRLGDRPAQHRHQCGGRGEHQTTDPCLSCAETGWAWTCGQGPAGQRCSSRPEFYLMQV